MSLTPNYVNYDFDSLVNELQKRLIAKNSAWTDVLESGTGQMITEFYAYIANLCLFYVERRAEECYLDTAKHKSSVINLVKLLNYRPKRKSSSIGLLTFTIPAAVGSVVYIDIGTSCETTDGTKFVVGERSSTGELFGGGYISAAGTTVDVLAIQGEIITKNITSAGNVNQSYTINDTSVEEDVFTVKVSTGSGTEVLWTNVSSFLNSTPESTHYRLVQELDDRLKVVFGDGINGKAPESGWVIEIKYLRSDGLDGNVYLSDQITTINTTIKAASGAEISDITVTNNNSFIGGDDAQDIEEIRYEAPRVFSTGDRAVTRDDFIALLEDYAGVANANVWGENEESPPNYDMFNKVNLSVIMQNWRILDDTLESQTIKTALTEYLYEKSMMTVKYEFIEPTIIKIIPIVEIKATLNYPLSQVASDVTASLVSDFTLGTTTKIGQLIKYSNISRNIDDLDSVQYHHLTLQVYEPIQATWQSTSTSGLTGTLSALPIKPDTVKVYVNDDLVGVDDGDGLLDSYTSTHTVSGTIDYTTGIVDVDIVPDPDSTDVVSIRYQQDADGDISPTNRQIAKLSTISDNNYRITLSYIS